MTIDIAEELKGLSPEQRAEREKDWADLLGAEYDVLEQLSPDLTEEFLTKVISGLTEESLAKVLAGLTLEQRKKLLELLSQPDEQKPE